MVLIGHKVRFVCSVGKLMSLGSLLGAVMYPTLTQTVNYVPRPWPKNLINIRNALDHLLTHHEIQTRQGLNHCLLNYYRSGSDSMGWHRDNEPELGRHPVVASLSLGEPRRFRLKSRISKAIPPITFDLGHGDLLVMYGKTQVYWEHALVKTKKIVGGRMNLTFRSVGVV